LEDDDDFAFSRTDVPVSLARFEGEHLVSRSQARRLLDRLRDFQQITLDFTGIESIAQSFADEVFRIYARNNPDKGISTVNTNEEIDRMIRRVISGTR
jgi:hypothetical protein